MKRASIKDLADQTAPRDSGGGESLFGKNAKTNGNHTETAPNDQLHREMKKNEAEWREKMKSETRGRELGHRRKPGTRGW